MTVSNIVVGTTVGGGSQRTQMNVAMLVHAYYLKDARVRRYAELLARDGHRVQVLCLRDENEPQTDCHLGVKIYRVNVARARGGKLSYVLEYLRSFLAFAVALTWSSIRGQRYEMVHVHNFPNFLIFAAICPKWLGARLILDVHDPMPELFRSKFKLGGEDWLIRILHLEERISLRFADMVIAANHRFRSILAERGCPMDKIEVVLNSPVEIFQSSPEPELGRARGEPFRVLYIGTLARRYGIDIAIGAVSSLKVSERISEIELLVLPKLADEGKDAIELKLMAAKLGLGEAFRILEPVAHDHMPAMIEKADVCVYTPRRDIHMDIALSLKIPEIVAVGRPLVSSRLPVLTEYFGDDCFYLFEAGDVEACAEQILRVYQNPDDVKHRIARAREALKGFAWEGQAQVYRTLLSEVLR